MMCDNILSLHGKTFLGESLAVSMGGGVFPLSPTPASSALPLPPAGIHKTRIYVSMALLERVELFKELTDYKVYLVQRNPVSDFFSIYIG